MNFQFLTTISLLMSSVCFAYEGPLPLQNIQTDFSISMNADGSYSYNYGFTNPSSNNGEIVSIAIAVDSDPTLNGSKSTGSWKHCTEYQKHSSETIASKQSHVEVGSDAPKDWSCSYSLQGNFAPISYLWGSTDEPVRIKPGNKLNGFSLRSQGLPAIRNLRIDPAIDVNRLPEDYEDDVNKMIALEEKVKWTGKSIGPASPPLTFNKLNFITQLIATKEQAAQLGWIKNQGLVTSLDAKLNDAQKKFSSGDNKAAKNVLNAFLSEVDAQKGKGLTAESYALLYVNAKYLIDHI